MNLEIFSIIQQHIQSIREKRKIENAYLQQKISRWVIFTLNGYIFSSSFHSALYSNDDQTLAAEGLLHRIAADQGHHLLPGQGVILEPPHRKSNRWWLISLLEWDATFQSHLCRQSTRPIEDSIHRPIITNPTSNLIELCNSMQLHRLADLIDYASGTSQ